MSWLTNFVRPKIQALVNRAQIGDALWVKCSSCEQMIFHRDLAERQKVCPHCDFHMAIKPSERFSLLFDEGNYQTIELPAAPVDPLKFRDRRRYADRLKEAQNKTGRDDAVIVVHGAIGGYQTVVCALDFNFMAGSMGVAVGDGFLAAARLAILQKAPLLIFTSSGGARMQEGVLSLMQMPRTIVALDEVRETGLPYIVILTHPTTGGVTASFAMLGDITLAEPDALVGFAGPRVIEDTIHESLPDGFQKSEYLFEHGMIDMVVSRNKLRDCLINLVCLLLDKRPTAEIANIGDQEVDIPELASENDTFSGDSPPLER
tara:strand:- start:282 stop:1235 length:954 start_codon:yes stop_codon:yes gene_type:complete